MSIYLILIVLCIHPPPYAYTRPGDLTSHDSAHDSRYPIAVECRKFVIVLNLISVHPSIPTEFPSTETESIAFNSNNGTHTKKNYEDELDHKNRKRDLHINPQEFAIHSFLLFRLLYDCPRSTSTSTQAPDADGSGHENGSWFSVEAYSTVRNFSSFDMGFYNWDDN